MRCAVWLTSGFCLLLVVIGLGIPALVGNGTVRAVDPSGATGILQLARTLDGSGPLLAAVSCAVFVTALAAVAGLTLAAASSVAHDLYAHAVRRGQVTGHQEVSAARWSSVLIGAAAVALACLAGNWNLQVLSVLALTLAASTLTPTFVYSLLWRRFTRTGALCTLYGTTVLVVLLTALSPQISGSASAAFPHLHFAWFPLAAPGIVTVPAGFLLGCLGSTLGRRAPARRHHLPDPAHTRR